MKGKTKGVGPDVKMADCKLNEFSLVRWQPEAGPKRTWVPPLGGST